METSGVLMPRRLHWLSLIGLLVLVAVPLGAANAPPEIRLVGGRWTAWTPPEHFEGDYIVRRGDTLWDLADCFYGSPFLWPELHDHNSYIEDAHWIYPGDPLVISAVGDTAHAPDRSTLEPRRSLCQIERGIKVLQEAPIDTVTSEMARTQLEKLRSLDLKGDPTLENKKGELEDALVVVEAQRTLRRIELEIAALEESDSVTLEQIQDLGKRLDGFDPRGDHALERRKGELEYALEAQRTLLGIKLDITKLKKSDSVTREEIQDLQERLDGFDPNGDRTLENKKSELEDALEVQRTLLGIKLDIEELKIRRDSVTREEIQDLQERLDGFDPRGDPALETKKGKLEDDLKRVEARAKASQFNYALLGIGLALVLLIVLVAVFLPEPTAFQHNVFRTALALGAGMAAAAVPGFLELDSSVEIAGGPRVWSGLAVFLLVYLLEPVRRLSADGPSAAPMAAAPVAPRSIFISYRRRDSADITGRIYERLKGRYGEAAVFKDVNDMVLGQDIRKVLADVLGQCRVVLAVVGPQWVDIQGEHGERRLEQTNDWVRIEVESALVRDLPVIPLLVMGAEMPKPEDLPDRLRGLSHRHGMQIRPDPDFDVDMARLIESLDSILLART